MRRLLVACGVVLVAGVVVSLAVAGSGSAPTGRWVLRTLSFPRLVEDAQPKLLNERGEIVGQARTRTVIWRNHKWFTIKPAQGMAITRPVAMNDRGRVVVQACSGSDFCDYGSRTVRSLVWHDGRLTDLGTLGGRSTRAWDINDKAEIVGASDTASHHVRAVLWRKGKLIELGTLGGKHSSAFAINEHSQVIGWSETADRKASPHLFLWANGRITDLGIPLGRAWSPATLPILNERGHITGHLRGCGAACGFLWRDGSLYTLKGLEPLGLNNRDEIPARGAGGRMVVWRDGQLTRLGDDDYGLETSRRIINDHGQIIVMDADGLQGLVWENGKRTYLPAYVPDRNRPDDRYSEVVAINNHGQIVGAGPWGRILLWTWQPAK